MADRQADWYLIQFTANMKRREPRNVGVALRSPQGWLARFFGVENGHVDGRRLRPLSVSADAYAAWVDHYTRHLNNDGWERVLRDRKERNFAVVPGGTIYETRATWATELDRLYSELVDDDTSSRTLAERESSLEIASRVLRVANIAAERDVQVEADFGERKTDVRWDFAHQNGSLHLMNSLRLTGRNPAILTESFYARAKAVGAARPKLTKFVCFYDGLENQTNVDRVLAPIEAVATTVDLSNFEEAVETVQRHVHS
jgi:hypothetical protein